LATSEAVSFDMKARTLRLMPTRSEETNRMTRTMPTSLTPLASLAPLPQEELSNSLRLRTLTIRRRLQPYLISRISTRSSRPMP
jgi:hypothetical protein